MPEVGGRRLLDYDGQYTRRRDLDQRLEEEPGTVEAKAQDNCQVICSHGRSQPTTVPVPDNGLCVQRRRRRQRPTTGGRSTQTRLH